MKVYAVLILRNGSFRHQKTLAVFWVIITLGSFLQAAWAQSNRLKFEHLLQEHGLSQGCVVSIIQDRQGFMWFATLDGLNKYDGARFTVYRRNPKDSTSISSNEINVILEDHAGFIWVGTRDGSNRYDRHTERFQRFYHDPKDSTSLGHSNILSLHEFKNSERHELWIGTGNGLHRFDREKNQFTRFQNNPADPNSLSGRGVYAILATKNAGKIFLWAGTARGLNLLVFVEGTSVSAENARFRRLQHNPDDPASLSYDVIRHLYLDSRGQLWASTFGGGLNKLPAETNWENGPFRFQKFAHDPKNPHSLAHQTVRPILEDRTGTMWFGTSGGLCRMTPEEQKLGRFARFPHEPLNLKSPSHNDVFALYEDRNGTLWIGTWGGGISKFSRDWHKFAHYAHDPFNPKSLSHEVVYGFAETRTTPAAPSTWWIGTGGGGLHEYDQSQDRFIAYRNDPKDPQSLVNNDIGAMATTTRRGKTALWIGTGNGLSCLTVNDSRRRFMNYLHDPKDQKTLSGNSISYIYSDPADSGRVVWVGTGSTGLNKLILKEEPGDWPAVERIVHYKHDPNNPLSMNSNNVISAVLADPFYQQQTLWVGTDKGLNRFDPATETFARYFHNEDDSTSLSNNRIYSLCIDQTGALWVGTGDGLNRFDRKRNSFRRYTTAEGLPNTTIYGILHDDDNNIWVSTNSGLSQFNPKRETFKNYDVSDGLQDNEFNNNAYYRSPSGLLFFGGIHGFNVFDPRQIQDNLQAPQIAITDFQIFNHSVPPGKDKNGRAILTKPIAVAERIDLTYEDYVFSFDLAALHYVNPARNQYAYIMEDFDKEWNDAGNRRHVTYTNLPSGDYTFRVKAANSDGVWNEKGIALKISVAPPFWQTWWFLSLAALAGLYAIYGGYRYRTRFLQQQNKMLEQKIAEPTQALEQEIGEHELTEEKLRLAKESAEAASQVKSQFLANMSHEIRTPLNGILGMTAILLDTGLQPRQRRFAQMVRTSADTLLRVINDILDFSKIEAGKLEIESVDFDLRLKMEDIVEMLAMKAHEKNLELVCRLDPAIPAALQGDPVRLQQVLLNLLSNAVKFTEQGEVFLQAACEANEKDAVKIRFEVSDTGIGIAPERLEQIFAPFVQADSSMTRRYGGTGLGLSIVKQLVELMGGQLGVESAANAGSRFWFTLSFAKSPSATAPATKQPLDKLRVLIVDGHARTRQTLREQINIWESIVDEAAGGGEALEKISAALKQDRPFNVALVDENLSGMTAATLAAMIQSGFQDAAVPVVLLATAKGHEDFAEEKERRFRAVLNKPVRAQMLYDCLYEIAHHECQKKKTMPAPPPQPVAPPTPAGTRILLVEDDVTNQAVAALILERFGYNVEIARSGKVALSLLETQSYDVVLMDVQMPDLDGVETTKQIRDRRSNILNHDVPIIAMTAHSMKGDEARFLEAGMNDYLAKPFDPDILPEVIGRYVKA